MVLIGADYVWSVVQDRVVRGNGSTAVESKIGYLLSGPINGCNKKSPSTSMMNIMTSHSGEEVDLEIFWKFESLGIEKMEPGQSHGTSWEAILQRTPWYGGWWERLIELTKSCLRKVLGKAFVSLAGLQTVATEVECILNDRSLTYVSSDQVDEEPLTPSHLLYGRIITSLNYTEEADTSVKRNTFSRHSQRVQQFT